MAGLKLYDVTSVLSRWNSRIAVLLIAAPVIAVLRYGLGRPVITPIIGNWSVFVLFGWSFVFGIIMRWDEREPSHPDVITTLGNNKAASLLLLSFESE